MRLAGICYCFHLILTLQEHVLSAALLRHIVGIYQGVFFELIRVTFFQLPQLILSTFCIEPPVSIDSSGQSCRRETETPSFGPATSGLVPENYL